MGRRINKVKLFVNDNEKLLSEERYNSELLREKAENNVEKKDPEVEALKIKAKQLQFLLDEQKKEWKRISSDETGERAIKRMGKTSDIDEKLTILAEEMKE